LVINLNLANLVNLMKKIISQSIALLSISLLSTTASQLDNNQNNQNNQNNNITLLINLLGKSIQQQRDDNDKRYRKLIDLSHRNQNSLETLYKNNEKVARETRLRERRERREKKRKRQERKRREKKTKRETWVNLKLEKQRHQHTKNESKKEKKTDQKYFGSLACGAGALGALGLTVVTGGLAGPVLYGGFLAGELVLGIQAIEESEEKLPTVIDSLTELRRKAKELYPSSSDSD